MPKEIVSIYLEHLQKFAKLYFINLIICQLSKHMTSKKLVYL